MNAAFDRLAQAKARPLCVEAAVRTALRDAVAWRIGGGAAPNAEAFGAAAVACARQTLDALAADTAERSRTLTAVHQAARCFSVSRLGRRLMSVPAAQFVRVRTTPEGPDAVIRDRRRRLHAVALKLGRDSLDAGRTATAIADATPLTPGDRLSPLTVHIFSLTSGQRRSFDREVALSSTRARVA